jgi:branched-subunit amino acid aminotransferase/4-amino-4-deoxychorismate lyase
LDLCFQHDIRFQEIPIVAKDLYMASECMILGTLTEITPVVQIDDRLVGNGRPGLITGKLQQALYEMIKKIKGA